jgi:hypothetical protein
MEHECNRLLTAMMVNSRPRAGLDLENATPDGGVDSKLRRDGGTALRARRLRGAEIKLIRTDVSVAVTTCGRSNSTR